MITRDIIYHLDFNISIDLPNKQCIFENKTEGEYKYIIVRKIVLVRKNKYQDFIFPASVTITRNDNYVKTIKGITSKSTEITPFYIKCTNRWKWIFDGYDSNTVIHLVGDVIEPEGRTVNG